MGRQRQGGKPRDACRLQRLLPSCPLTFHWLKQKTLPSQKSLGWELYSTNSSRRCHKVIRKGHDLCTSTPHMSILIAWMVGKHLLCCRRITCFQNSLAHFGAILVILLRWIKLSFMWNFCLLMVKIMNISNFVCFCIFCQSLSCMFFSVWVSRSLWVLLFWVHWIVKWLGGIQELKSLAFHRIPWNNSSMWLFKMSFPRSQT